MTGVQTCALPILTVETAVPVGAVFTDTDTVYDDTAIQTAVDLNTAKVSNVDHPSDSLVAQNITDIGNLSGTNTGDQDLSGLATKTIATPVKSAAYTVGTDNTDEAYGGVVYTSSTGIITLPVLAVGMHLAVIAAGGVIVTIDPNGVDKIIIDGTDATAGVTITSPGDVGDIAVLTYHSAGTWFASTNTWGMGA